MKRRLLGFTLPEVMIVTAIISITLLTIFAVATQAASIYASTAQRIEPEASMTLALTRMQREVREAIFIRKHADNWVEFTTPSQTDNLNDLESDGTIKQGIWVCYFLGRKDRYDDAWTLAIPDSAGDTLFRIAGPSPGVSNIPLKASYNRNQVEILIESVRFDDPAKKKLERILLSTPVVKDPTAVGGERAVSIFEFEPLENENVTEKTRMFVITLTMAHQVVGPQGFTTHKQTLSTAFCLRNNPN